jgi:glycosyltransferase involved in cell wall biosynthesis
MLVRLHERSVDYVVGVSHGVVGQWHQLASTGVPAAVIQNWIHEDWLSGSSLGAQVPRGILCVGRFNSWKGQEALADAYELAFQDGSRPQLTFLGAEESPSPFHEKAARIEARGAGKWNVLPVTENSKGAMRQANLLVVPSLHPEPFGLVIVEALAAGCKVIAFEGGGPTDLAKDFPTSLEVVPRSISALAEALRRWWDTGGDRQQPREHQETLATLHKRYSRETAGAKWSAVIASMTVG